MGEGTEVSDEHVCETLFLRESRILHDGDTVFTWMWVIQSH